MPEKDFVPFQPPISSEEQEKAIAGLKKFQDNMKYDSVRGFFSIKVPDFARAFEISDTISIAGNCGTIVGPDTVHAVFDSKENTEKFVSMLKDKGFNFPGVKDAPSKQAER